MAHATPQGEMFEYIDMDQWGARSWAWKPTSSCWDILTFKGCGRSAGLRSSIPAAWLARDHRGKACYAVYEEGRIELKRSLTRWDDRGRAARSPLSDRVIEGLVARLGTRAKANSLASVGRRTSGYERRQKTDTDSTSRATGTWEFITRPWFSA